MNGMAVWFLAGASIPVIAEPLKGDLPVRFCPSPKVIAVILMFTNLFRPALFRLWNLMGLELLDTDS
jgi:hypothetical protein